MSEVQNLERELKQNFGVSMEPYTLEMLARYIQLKNEGTQSGGGTITFPADLSLDISLHRNRLVMADNGVAKLANVSGGGGGAKGKYRIETNSLPQYPVGAIYEFDFMGVNFNDGDEIFIPIIEQHNVVTSYKIATAKTIPTGSGYFAIGVDLAASLTGLLNVLQTHIIGAWEVSINGTKIVFKNDHILTGINGSSSYALPSDYNGIESKFIRRDIEIFNNTANYTIVGTFSTIDFNSNYGGGQSFNLDVQNLDGYYPIIGISNWFVDTNGNIAYNDGSGYIAMTSITRDEAGTCTLVAGSAVSQLVGCFSQWTATFSTNLGTNYTITQTRQGIDGIVQAWVDANLNQNSQGFMIYFNDGNCNNRLVIHAFGLMGNFTNIGIPLGEYGDFSIPTTTLELSRILKENIIQNPNTFFSVTADGHSLPIPESWVEIEELSTQTQDNCNPNLITWYEYGQGSDPFNTWFVRTQIQAPILGVGAILSKPILGFLQDVVNGEALISDTNVNIGIIEDIAGNDITQQQLNDIENDIENVLYCYYALGTDGQLKKLTLLGNFQDAKSYINLGGGLFVGCHPANGGEELLVRRVLSFGN